MCPTMPNGFVLCVLEARKPGLNLYIADSGDSSRAIRSGLCVQAAQYKVGRGSTDRYAKSKIGLGWPRWLSSGRWCTDRDGRVHDCGSRADGEVTQTRSSGLKPLIELMTVLLHRELLLHLVRTRTNTFGRPTGRLRSTWTAAAVMEIVTMPVQDLIKTR
jgi:hypothetical protein